MSWKEFLKLTNTKIALTIVLTIIELFSIFSCYVYDANPCGPLSYILIPISVVFYIILEFMGDLIGIFGWLIISPIFIGIIMYFISCLIIWVYNKVKKK